MNQMLKKYLALFLLCVMVLNVSASALSKDQADKEATVYATVIEIEKYGHAVLDMTAKFYFRRSLMITCSASTTIMG